MTSRYRVEYSLKKHRRDEFIEWIKSLLAVPFVLHSDSEKLASSTFENSPETETYEQYLLSQEHAASMKCRQRYQEVFADVEKLITNTIIIDMANESKGTNVVSRLRKLVPSIGKFYTPLPLAQAFLIADDKRLISKRQFVSPSFNDIRSTLNIAQILALSSMYNEAGHDGKRLKLITFDGDVTLYDDGCSLREDDVIVGKLMKLLSLGFFIGVVTAAGYPSQSGAANYYERLKGLIDKVTSTEELTDRQKENLLVMGGESNYLFRYDTTIMGLRYIEADEWYLPSMKGWSEERINYIMGTVHRHLIHLQKKLKLNGKGKTEIIRKERSIGIIPVPGFKILREHLEEMVLSCSVVVNEMLKEFSEVQRNLELDFDEISSKSRYYTTASDDGQNIKVCAFNGGSDVWVDIGDKSLGVECLQRYLCKDEANHLLCPIQKSESLHIGDQFASLGANDFKARSSACTVWIANPKETDEILGDLIGYIGNEN